jgi:hypothetical protein
MTAIGRKIGRGISALSGIATLSAIGTALSASTLQDNFNDNALTPVWNPSTSGAGFVTSEVNDRLELTLPSGVAGNASAVSSSAQALTNMNFFVEAVRVSPTQSAYTTKFQFGTLGATSPKVAIGTYTASGVLRLGFFTSISGGTQNTITANTVYSRTSHAWWRLRESGGVVYADVSDDSVTWVHPDGLSDGATAWKITSSTLGLVPSPIVLTVAASDTTGTLSDISVFDNLNIPRAATYTATVIATMDATGTATANARRIQRRTAALTADSLAIANYGHIQRRPTTLSASATVVAAGQKLVPATAIGGLTRVAGADTLFISRSYDVLTWTLTRDGTEPTVMTVTKTYTDIL